MYDDEETLFLEGEEPCTEEDDNPFVSYGEMFLEDDNEDETTKDAIDNFYAEQERQEEKK